jgi:hypothetical protein
MHSPPSRSHKFVVRCSPILPVVCMFVFCMCFFLWQLLQLCQNGEGSRMDLMLGGFKCILSKYLKTPHHPDLVFSPTFSIQELDMMRKEAMRQGLAIFTCPPGKKSKKYFVVSQRRTAFEVMEHVRCNKGQDLRFSVQQPPGLYSFIIGYLSFLVITFA